MCKYTSTHTHTHTHTPPVVEIQLQCSVRVKLPGPQEAQEEPVIVPAEGKLFRLGVSLMGQDPPSELLNGFYPLLRVLSWARAHCMVRDMALALAAR